MSSIAYEPVAISAIVISAIKIAALDSVSSLTENDTFDPDVDNHTRHAFDIVDLSVTIFIIVDN